MNSACFVAGTKVSLTNFLHRLLMICQLAQAQSRSPKPSPKFKAGGAGGVVSALGAQYQALCEGPACLALRSYLRRY